MVTSAVGAMAHRQRKGRGGNLFRQLSGVQNNMLKTTNFISDKEHWENKKNYLNIRPGSYGIDSILQNKFCHNLRRGFKNFM